MADVDLSSVVERAGVSDAPSDTQSEGLVVAKVHGFVEVAVGSHTYLCTLRGRLRKQRPPLAPTLAPAGRRPPHGPSSRHPAIAPSPVSSQRDDGLPILIAPGDRVIVTLLSASAGVVDAVLPRTAVLSRTRPEVGGEQILLANADLAVLVFAVRAPALDRWLLDRYLVICEHARVPVLICLNKLDLGMPAEAEAAERLYASLGYEVLCTSAATGAGLGDLRARLAGHVSLLTGPSGVGKSSLMNALLPAASQRIGEMSAATGKGKHTTTGARLLPVSDGGWLANSAGIRELTPWNVPADELVRCFVELRPLADDCLYDDCAHSEVDAGCALRAALAEMRIAPERFTSFVRLLAVARAAEPPAWATRER